MIGEQIVFTTDSPVHKDTYSSKILSVKNNLMSISIPFNNGAIVLPGVGTRLSVHVTSLNYKFQCEILERNIMKKCLTVSTPDSISRINNSQGVRQTRVISVTSGKGGVGKTSFTINFAIALSNLNKKVLVFDADLGMANIDVLLNIRPDFDILDVINGDKTIQDVIIDAPGNVKLIPGASGVQQLAYLSDSEFNRIISGFNEIESDYDYMIIDTGAGLSKNVTDFLMASDEILLVTTTEPHAIMDAYSIIKVLKDLGCKNSITLIINKCDTRPEALEILNNMHATCMRFLNVNINYLGHIFDDKNVSKSLKSRIPLAMLYPESQAAKCITDIAKIYTGNDSPAKKEQGIVKFLNKLKKLF